MKILNVERISVTIFYLFIASVVVAEDAPKLLFDFGTSKADVLYDMGNPRLYPDAHSLVYVSNTGRAEESTIFLFDADDKLIGFAIHILPQYNTPLPLSEYLGRLYNEYLKLFTSHYGEPMLGKENNVYWKYDDSFVAYMLYYEQGFPKLYFTVMKTEYAQSRGFGFLYE